MRKAPMEILLGGLDDPKVQALLIHHTHRARAVTPPGSSHALDLAGLRVDSVTFWSAWQDQELVGVGALKLLSEDHGEVKSMHTVEARRHEGIGSAMLLHIIAAARSKGLSRLSLETGSFDHFLPARALYRKHGFVECPPFGDYRPDVNSVFMTLSLTSP